LKFSAATYSIAENAGSATITVSRTGGTASGVTVNYATANISATAGSDYTSASGTLTFDAGDTSKTFSVPLLDDTFVEGPEMVSLSLGAATGGASLGSPSTATLTITENDAGGTLQLSAPTYSVAENVGTATVTVTRTGGAASGVSVHYATTGGTASVGSDYTTTSGDLAFGAGDSTKTFTVPITNDAIQETSETFDVQLTSATGGSALGTPSFATVTITDDDAANGTLGLAACSVVVREGQASVAIPVQRTAGSNGVVTIQYATQNIDAIAGTDYTAASGTLSWPSGNANVQTITVPLSTNAGIEPRERFRVALSTPTGGASLGAIPNVVVWILDTPDQVFVDKFGDAWPCQ
jgi:hypothetical protein